MDMIAPETMVRGLAPFLLVKVTLVVGAAQQAAVRAVPSSSAVQRARGKPADGREERAKGGAVMADPAAEHRATPGWWANPSSDGPAAGGGAGADGLGDSSSTIWLPAEAQSWPAERALRAGGSWRAEGALTMGHQANFKGRMRALLDKNTDRSPLDLRTGLLMSATGGLFALLVTALNFGMTPVQAGTSAYVWLEMEAGALPLRGGHVGDV